MPPTAHSGVGHRVAAARVARRMTQKQLAGAACISLSMLRKVEQGSRQPSDLVLSTLADALSTTPQRLAGERTPTSSRVHSTLPALRAAIDTYDLPEDGPARPLPELRAAVGTVTRLRLASQYARIAVDQDKEFIDEGGLAGLLNELARAVQKGQGRDREEAVALLVMAYRAADGIAFKYGYYDLSSHIIHLMRWLAGRSGDAMLEAAVAYVRAETFFASQTLGAGLRGLESAIDAVPPGRSIESKAAKGALHMRAAVTAGRLIDGDRAWLHIREARRLAIGASWRRSKTDSRSARCGWAGPRRVRGEVSHVAWPG
jgi:transcriptional regulator with XRE-family HTH domain